MTRRAGTRAGGPGTLEAVNQEIAREKAETLGRAGERLEWLLGELGSLAAALQETETSASPAAVARAERRYEALRERALQARHHLIIQREAVGFRRHPLVTGLFPVPPLRARREIPPDAKG